jgi:hypothetical protein
LPQVVAPSSAQSFRGSVFTSAGRQVPTFWVDAHVTQTPLQALLQQTPSAQNVDEQSAPVEQGCPSAARILVGRSTEPASVPT